MVLCFLSVDVGRHAGVAAGIVTEGTRSGNPYGVASDALEQATREQAAADQEQVGVDADGPAPERRGVGERLLDGGGERLRGARRCA